MCPGDTRDNGKDKQVTTETEQVDEKVDPVAEAIALLDPSFGLLAQGAVDAQNEMTAIVAKLKAAAGTQAQVLVFGTECTLALPVPDSIVWPAAKDRPKTLADLATWLDEANEWAAQVHTDERAALLKAAGHKDESGAALKEAFATHKGVVEAFQTLAATMPGFPEKAKFVADSLVIPSLKGTTSGGKGIRKGGVVWGITRDGVKSDIAASQNKFSSSAYYYSQNFTADGSKMTTDQWRQYIRKECSTFKSDSDTFSVTSADGKVTAWCEHRMEDEAPKEDEA